MNRWFSRHKAEEKMWPRGARVEVEDPVGWTGWTFLVADHHISITSFLKLLKRTNPELMSFWNQRFCDLSSVFQPTAWLLVFHSNSLLCLFGSFSRFFFRIFTVSACDAFILKQCIWLFWLLRSHFCIPSAITWCSFQTSRGKGCPQWWTERTAGHCSGGGLPTIGCIPGIPIDEWVTCYKPITSIY